MHANNTHSTPNTHTTPLQYSTPAPARGRDITDVSRSLRTRPFIRPSPVVTFEHLRSITGLCGNLVDKFESPCEVLRSDSRGAPQVWHGYDDDGGGVSVKDLSLIMQVTTRPDRPPQRPLRCETPSRWGLIFAVGAAHVGGGRHHDRPERPGSLVGVPR